MLRLIVRSKRDADALKAMLEQALPSWNAEVVTLKGARKEKILEKIWDAVASDKFNIVLLGREDSSVAKRLSEETPSNVIVHVVPRARVRNARLSHLRWELEKAKAQPRGWIAWEGPTPYLSKKYPVRVEPSDEPFAAWGLWWRTTNLGAPRPDAMLIFKRSKGYHEVYSRGRVVAMMELPDEGQPTVTKLGEVEGFGLKRAAELSAKFLKEWEFVTVKSLGSCEKAVVPWSAGKDSTAALLIAKEACDEVIAIYVDTGVDMYLNKFYVEHVAERLGVELRVAKAPVREEIMKRGLPSREDRWCTGLKLKALEKEIKTVKPDVIIVGDRDAESSARSSRWGERVWEGVGVVKAPLKLWSAFQVQLYLLWKGIFPNPLYPSGFYRLGCYVCPFFRSYEKELMRSVKAARMGVDEGLLSRFLAS